MSTPKPSINASVGFTNRIPGSRLLRCAVKKSGMVLGPPTVYRTMMAKTRRSMEPGRPFLCSVRTRCAHGFLLGWVSLMGLAWDQDAWAQRNLDAVRQVQYIETDPQGYPEPTGLAYSGKAGEFFILEQSRGTTDLVRINPIHKRSGVVHIPETIRDPINMAYDGKADRMLILQSKTNQLIEISAGADGVPRADALRLIQAEHFGVNDPQGITVDPVGGALFILDTTWSLILRVEPDPVMGFAQPMISEIDLRTGGLDGFALRGIALDPTTGHLFVLDPDNLRLYEVTDTGVVVTNRDVSGFGLKKPQAMVFAPSGDRTDDPSVMNLYIVNSGDHAGPKSAGANTDVTGGITELAVTQ